VSADDNCDLAISWLCAGESGRLGSIPYPESLINVIPISHPTWVTTPIQHPTVGDMTHAGDDTIS
jgi:hypothetical protein